MPTHAGPPSTQPAPAGAGHSRTSIAAIWFIVGCLFFVVDGTIMVHAEGNVRAFLYFLGSVSFLVGSVLWYIDVRPGAADGGEKRGLLADAEGGKGSDAGQGGEGRRGKGSGYGAAEQGV